MNEIYTKLALHIKIGEKFYSQIPCTKFRRHAHIIFGNRNEGAFEYAISKGLVTGSIIGLLVILFMFAGTVGLIKGLILLVLSIPVGVWLESEELKRMVSKREKAITIVFSRISSNCLLFLTSGLSVRRAFIESVKQVNENCVKNALNRAVSDLETNAKTSEVFAVLNEQMKHPYVAEFTSILEQVERYGNGANSDLNRLIKASWQMRRDVATQSAKEMETKLVFPSMLIFLGVMLMVAVGLILQMS